jgi:hypothetical protein
VNERRKTQIKAIGTVTLKKQLVEGRAMLIDVRLATCSFVPHAMIAKRVKEIRPWSAP